MPSNPSPKDTYTIRVKKGTEELSTITFTWIPPGTFQQSTALQDTGNDLSPYADADEAPQHEVKISRGFWIQSIELSQKSWEAVTGTNPSRFKNCGPTCPVEQVNWYEAIYFANRLSELHKLTPCYKTQDSPQGLGGGCPGKGPGDVACGGGFVYKKVERVPNCTGYRLPTESEWEYMARAGDGHDTYNGNFETSTLKQNTAPELNDIAVYGGNSGVDGSNNSVSYAGAFLCEGWSEKQFSSKHCGTHPSARKLPNHWGVYDALGNAWEWCEDVYDAGVYGTRQGRVTVDPIRWEDSGGDRVARGGSWDASARRVRLANRDYDDPGRRYGRLGFRLLRLAP